VLTHPAFDRPPVHNERRRCHKKGTHNLTAARRAREASHGGAARAPLVGAVPAPGVHEATTLPVLDAGSLVAWQSRAMALPPRDPLATPRPRHEDAVISAALAIIEQRLRLPGAALVQSPAVKDYLRLHLAGCDREVFGVLFLDARLRLIAFEVLFEGTLTHTSVHAREVARRSLQLNAAA
jgi:RadC-like JAB domain